MRIDLTKIAGEQKQIWWYSPVDGSLQYAGTVEDGIREFRFEGPEGPANDHVLIAFDSTKNYLTEGQQSL